MSGVGGETGEDGGCVWVSGWDRHEGKGKVAGWLVGASATR